MRSSIWSLNVLYVFFWLCWSIKIPHVCRYFRNMLSSHTLFASFSTLKCAFHVGMSVFVIPPTANLSNNISKPWVANWWKTQHISAMEASKRTGTEIADSTQPTKHQHPSKKHDQRHIKMWINQLINLQDGRLLLSVAVVPVAWPGRRNNSLQYFEFGLQ